MTKKDEFVASKQLIDDILKIDRNQLRELRNMLVHMTSNQSIILTPKKSKKPPNKEIVELVGTLPFVLLDKKYFPDNKSLVTFAEKHLNIKATSAPSRGRNEIIGTIIAKISEKNKKDISDFATALNKILGKQEKGDIKNFFTEWSRVISET